MSSKSLTATGWLNKKLSEAKSFYIFASLLSLVSAASFIVFCWYLAQFSATWLTSGIVNPNYLLISLVFLVSRYVFAHYSSVLNYNASSLIVSKIKKETYPSLLNHNELDSTTATLYVTKISDDLKPYYAFFIPYAIASVLVGILILVVAFFVEKWVSVILFVALLVIPMQMIVIGVGAETLHKKHINLFLKYSAVFYNRLQTIAEIINLDNFKPQYKFLQTKSKALNKATTNVMSVAILSSAILELFVTLSIAAIAIYFGMSLLGIMPGASYNAGYNFQTALFLLTLSPYFFFYLRKFISAYHDRNRALAAAKLLIPILETEKPTEHEGLDADLKSFSIKDLSFAYPNSPVKVLHDISLDFPQKGLVLAKGISGSGKSTLLKICSGSLFGFEGNLTVNNQPNDWTTQWLKENSSYMNQFPFIFDGSIRYNVFLNENSSETKDYPPFLDIILTKKPEGWDTELSHNGKQLSGGERQLITLARLVLYPKPIAILDEPTANLDSETIDIIIPEIIKLAENSLVILASHESKFDAVADKIIELNWGEQMQISKQ